MKQVNYSILCEDVAHYYFLTTCLPLFSAKHNFQLDYPCFKRFQASNKSQVLNGYVDVANKAFREYNLDLFFIVVDHDDAPKDQFQNLHKEITEAIFENIRDKVMVLIPVRCIEHWLRYLQWRNENPESTRNVPMEDEVRWESKVKVYGSKKPSAQKTESTIQTLIGKEGIDWLCSRSPSFRHFHKQVSDFVEL